MSYASLSIDLKAQLANLQSGMDKAVRLAEKDAARMEKAFGAVRAIAGGIGGALVAGLGGAGLSQFIIQTNDALLAIKDLAEGTGSTVENVSALENALRLNNRTLAEAQPVLVKFNGALKEADGKNGISQALQAIGLSAEELRKLDPVQALQKVAQALQGFNDDGNKARLVQELFGKSVAEVIPLLNDLADSQLKATDGIRQATEEADKFEKNLAKLKTEAGDLARTLAGPLVAGLNKVFDALKGGASKDLDLTRRQITLLVDYINKNGDSPALPKLVSRLKELRDREQALAGQLPAGSGRPANEGGGGLATLRNLPAIGNATAAARAARGVGPGAKDFIGPEIPQGLADALKAIEATDFNRVAALNQQLQELLAVERAGGVNPAVAEAIAKTRQQLEELDPAARKAADEAKRLQDILDSTPGGTFRAVLKDIDLINKAFEKGAIDANTWAQAVKTASDPLRKGGTGSDEGDDIAKQLGMSFQSAAEDAIVFGKKASEVLRSLEQDILRLVTRKWVTTPLLGALDELLGGGKDGGGFDLGALVSKGLGSLFGGLPSFDVGTDFVPRDMVARVHKGERIVPARENIGGGRAISVTINQTFAGQVDRSTQQQAATAAGQAVQRALARNG